jgi:hypothetical protein
VIIGFPALTAIQAKDVQQPCDVLLIELPRIVGEFLMSKVIKRYFDRSAECPALLPKYL